MKCPKCQHENPDNLIFCEKCATRLGRDAQPSFTKTIEILTTRLSIGSLFAERYEVLEELGIGGMGEVYRVKDQKLDEEMALKVIKHEISAHGGAIERFKNELKLARKIAHRHVCRMYDLNEEQDTPFITMEYVKGEDLKGSIRKNGKLKEEVVIAIAKQVCEGLSEAHRQGIVHRDLKPQNIMIDEKGNAKIMDFGIARLAETPGLTHSGVMIGTPEYMSPEQAEGIEADQRTDIYALGVMMYEMATGSVPFKGDTALSLALKHKTKLPQDPRKLNPEISENLVRLILICMEKDRERRYQSAEALLTDLVNLENGLPLGTKIRPRQKTALTTLVHRKLFVPAAIFLLAVIAVVLWQFRPDKSIAVPKIENSIAVISFANQTGETSQDILRRNIPNLLITNLENTGFFQVLTWDRLRDLLKQMGETDDEAISRELGFKLCRREGIESLVLGSVMKVGNVFATDVKVYDVETEKLKKSTTSQGEGVDSIIHSQIAELSREIALGVGITRERVESAHLNISELTTTSMEAYNYFIKGREDLYNQYFNDAIKRLEKAVELDPNFAVAYLFLGLTFRNLEEALPSDVSNARKYIEKAKALSDTVTDKERLWIEAVYAFAIELNIAKGVDILNAIVERYPRDKLAHLELSKYYRNIDANSEVIKHSEIVLALDPSWGDAYEEIALAYSNTGNDEMALEYLRKGSAAIPGDPNMSLSMGYFYVRMGKIDEAIIQFKTTLDIKPDYNIENYLAYAYAMKEDYAKAFSWIDRFITNAPSEGRKATGYFIKGFYRYWLGSPKQALVDLQKAWDLHKKAGARDYLSEYVMGIMNGDIGEYDISRDQYQSWHDGLMAYTPQDAQEQRSFTSSSLHLGLGQNDVKQGNLDSAKSHLKAMEANLPKMVDPGKIQAYNKLLGEILISEKSYDEAIAALKDEPKRKMPWLWQTQPIFAYNLSAMRTHLAQAYEGKGDLDQAITFYERRTDPNPENRDGLLIYPKNYYELARLYELKDRRAKAIDLYEKFLFLWKDADPGLPEVEDARKRLAGLKGS